jgi:hypothetical protein
MHLRTHRMRTPALLLVLALAAVLLAACGSSSSTTTGSNASASATAPGGSGSTGASGATGARGGRFKAVRECLTKQGITLPTPPSGARRPGGGGFQGGGGISGGQKLPAGVTRQQFEAALKKCGAGARFGKRRSLAKNPAFKKSLAAFSTCMSEHGIKLPAPNTSGNGPVFNTSGINTKSKAFATADEACRSKIHFFAPRAGGEAGARPGGPPPGGTPPAEGTPENG